MDETVISISLVESITQIAQSLSITIVVLIGWYHERERANFWQMRYLEVVERNQQNEPLQNALKALLARDAVERDVDTSVKEKKN